MSLALAFNIEDIWEDIEKYVASVIPYVHGEFTVADIKAKLVSNTYNLVVFKERDSCIGIIVFSTQLIAGKKAAFILIAAGRAITTKQHWAELKALLSSYEYKYVEAAMRDSTLRLWSSLGFKKKYNVAGVNL